MNPDSSQKPPIPIDSLEYYIRITDPKFTSFLNEKIKQTKDKAIKNSLKVLISIFQKYYFEDAAEELEPDDKEYEIQNSHESEEKEIFIKQATAERVKMLLRGTSCFYHKFLKNGKLHQYKVEVLQNIIATKEDTLLEEFFLFELEIRDVTPSVAEITNIQNIFLERIQILFQPPSDLIFDNVIASLLFEEINKNCFDICVSIVHILTIKISELWNLSKIENVNLNLDEDYNKILKLQLDLEQKIRNYYLTNLDITEEPNPLRFTTSQFMLSLKLDDPNLLEQLDQDLETQRFQILKARKLILILNLRAEIAEIAKIKIRERYGIFPSKTVDYFALRKHFCEIQDKDDYKTCNSKSSNHNWRLLVESQDSDLQIAEIISDTKLIIKEFFTVFVGDVQDVPNADKIADLDPKEHKELIEFLVKTTDLEPNLVKFSNLSCQTNYLYESNYYFLKFHLYLQQNKLTEARVLYQQHLEFLGLDNVVEYASKLLPFKGIIDLKMPEQFEKKAGYFNLGMQALILDLPYQAIKHFEVADNALPKPRNLDFYAGLITEKRSIATLNDSEFEIHKRVIELGKVCCLLGMNQRVEAINVLQYLLSKLIPEDQDPNNDLVQKSFFVASSSQRLSEFELFYKEFELEDVYTSSIESSIVLSAAAANKVTGIIAILQQTLTNLKEGTIECETAKKTILQEIFEYCI